MRCFISCGGSFPSFLIKYLHLYCRLQMFPTSPSLHSIVNRKKAENIFTTCHVSHSIFSHQTYCFRFLSVIPHVNVASETLLMLSNTILNVSKLRLYYYKSDMYIDEQNESIRTLIELVKLKGKSMEYHILF